MLITTYYSSSLVFGGVNLNVVELSLYITLYDMQARASSLSIIDVIPIITSMVSWTHSLFIYV